MGDLFAVWADRLLADCDLPAASLLAARRWYDRMRIETIAGQYLDLSVRTWTPSAVLRIARHKTAAYTVAWPLWIAGNLASGSEALLHAYWSYGVAVGEAFQLRDDLLGVFGDPARTGKPVGDDLRQGKPTVLAAIALEHATGGQRGQLEAGLGNTGLSEPDVEKLSDVITDTGAPEIVSGLIGERLDRAAVALRGSALPSEAEEALLDLAAAAADRPG